MAAHSGSEHGQILDDAGRRKYLNAAERARFLDAASCLAPSPAAFCLVLAYSGCRVSEALALTVHHINPESCTLTFRTLKRRKVSFRSVPMPELLIARLAALRPAEDGRLWTMHRATAWHLVKTLMQWAQITGPMACPRGLRHGFGIRAAGCGIQISLIQRWMGHASQVTTAIYLDAVGIEERQMASRMWK